MIAIKVGLLVIFVEVTLILNIDSSDLSNQNLIIWSERLIEGIEFFIAIWVEAFITDLYDWLLLVLKLGQRLPEILLFLE